MLLAELRQRVRHVDQGPDGLPDRKRKGGAPRRRWAGTIKVEPPPWAPISVGGFGRDRDFETPKIALDCVRLRRVVSGSSSNFNRSARGVAGDSSAVRSLGHQFSKVPAYNYDFRCVRIYRGRVRSRGRVSQRAPPVKRGTRYPSREETPMTWLACLSACLVLLGVGAPS